MKTMFGNAVVAWSEREIIRRESLVREISQIVKDTFLEINPAVQMVRCETPILTPESVLQSHIDEKFELIPAGEGRYLRPETTAGTYEYFNQMFPQREQRLKRLPFCVWQAGISFRDEVNPDTMRASNLRLRQFYQMEFQLFTRADTKAPYLESVLNKLVEEWGGSIVEAQDLPHYSEKTLDWHIDGLEVAGCSIRKDWPDGKVFEIAIGLDRLVALGV